MSNPPKGSFIGTAYALNVINDKAGGKFPVCNRNLLCPEYDEKAGSSLVLRSVYRNSLCL